MSSRHRILWLWSLDWAGRTWRASTAEITVEIDGEEVYYPPGLLSVSAEESLDLLSLDPPNADSSFEVELEDADWPQLRAQRHRWDTARGSLYYVVTTDGEPGTPVPFLSGELSGIEYGSSERIPGWLRGQIRLEAAEDSARLLSPDWRLDTTSWPHLAYDSLSSVRGKTPPRVFGRPGLVRRGAITRYVAAVPGYPVERRLGPLVDRVALSSQPIPDTQVYLLGGGTGVWNLVDVEVVADGTGRLIPTVDVSALGPPSYVAYDLSPGTEWWWATSAETGPGALSLLSTRPGLGDVVLSLLHESSLDIDWRRMEAAVPLLNEIEVGGCVTDPDLSPWALVADLLALIPCTVCRSMDGLYVLPLRPVASHEVQHRLVEGVDARRVGAVEVMEVQAPSSIELSWAISHDTSAPTEMVRLRADPTDEEGVLIADSGSALGLTLDPKGKPLRISTPYLWSADDAWRSATARLRALPAVRERIEMELPPHRYGVLLAQSVALEDAGLGRTLIGMVVRRAWAGDSWTISLVVDELADRDEATP